MKEATIEKFVEKVYHVVDVLKDRRISEYTAMAESFQGCFERLWEMKEPRGFSSVLTHQGRAELDYTVSVADDAVYVGALKAKLEFHHEPEYSRIGFKHNYGRYAPIFPLKLANKDVADLRIHRVESPYVNFTLQHKRGNRNCAYFLSVGNCSGEWIDKSYHMEAHCRMMRLEHAIQLVDMLEHVLGIDK